MPASKDWLKDLTLKSAVIFFLFGPETMEKVVEVEFNKKFEKYKEKEENTAGKITET